MLLILTLSQFNIILDLLLKTVSRQLIKDIVDCSLVFLCVTR